MLGNVKLADSIREESLSALRATRGPSDVDVAW